jgi:hypothetical protein
MRQLFILIVIIFSGYCLSAQQNINAERKLYLLKKLQLTPTQRIQIQQLIREEKLEEYLRYLKLQQVLTPAQRKTLLQVKETSKPATDSLKH